MLISYRSILLLSPQPNSHQHGFTLFFDDNFSDRHIFFKKEQQTHFLFQLLHFLFGHPQCSNYSRLEQIQKLTNQTSLQYERTMNLSINRPIGSTGRLTCKRSFFCGSFGSDHFVTIQHTFEFQRDSIGRSPEVIREDYALKKLTPKRLN